MAPENMTQTQSLPRSPRPHALLSTEQKDRASVEEIAAIGSGGGSALGGGGGRKQSNGHAATIAPASAVGSRVGSRSHSRNHSRAASNVGVDVEDVFYAQGSSKHGKGWGSGSISVDGSGKGSWLMATGRAPADGSANVLGERAGRHTHEA